MSTPRAQIAANVRAETARSMKTQSQVARHLGIDKSSMAKRYNGQREFTGTELVTIAAFLDIDVMNLLALAAEPATPNAVSA